MKKIMNFALMAVLTVGLSLAATSCKDDDNDNGNGNGSEEQAASTGGDMTLAESQLASLISNFGGLEAQEQLEQSDWKSKTYKADLGLVLNESRPTVRTIEVGTLETADEEACALLSALGINYASPAGFTFADSEVGTVSYQHGGGTDANTLAVINLDVKGLTGITQLQMVNKLPANAGGEPYYHVGDVIRKKNDPQLWLCVRAAENVGGQAYFVSFWTDHSKGTCSWGKQKDVVYAAKKPMASYLALSSWMREFLMHDMNYKALLKNLQQKSDAEGHIEDLLPATEEARKELILALQMKPDDTRDREPLGAYKLDDYKWAGIENDANGRTIAPRGRLLCDIFRYSMGFTYDYWVPAVSWVSMTDSIGVLAALKREPAQNEGKHFQYEESKRFNAHTSYLSSNLDNSSYKIVKTAVHWQHKYFKLDGKSNQWAVFDFTLDWKDHPSQNADWTADSKKWTRRNITSSELKITDRGEAQRNYEFVLGTKLNDADADDESKIHIDEVKLYSIIGQDGHFYDNVAAADAAGTEAIAIVIYLGGTKRVEKGTDWNGLAMALEPSSLIRFLDNDMSGDACALTTWEAKDRHNDLTGLAATETLQGDCGHGHQHPAAKYCHEWLIGSPFTARATEFSPWFMPSYGQWVLFVKGRGLQYEVDEDAGYPTITGNLGASADLKTILTDAGVPALYDVLEMKVSSNNNRIFWTTTTPPTGNFDFNMVYVFQCIFSPRDLNEWQRQNEDEARVMPFIAFRYGSGGTED